LIAGAGPVGLVAAAALIRAGIPVQLLESGPGISEEMRASTLPAPRLDMLDDLGGAQEMTRQGIIGPRVQYRRRDQSLIAEFDFGLLANVTRHPYRLQCEQFKLTRILLAGDAAHINNPLGRMGLNGGVHDAVNLVEKLVQLLRGEADESLLDRYDRQRRGVTEEVVQRTTIQNKKNLEAVTPEGQADFQSRMAHAASDPARAHAHLLGMSMINSLRRAAEIA